MSRPGRLDDVIDRRRFLRRAGVLAGGAAGAGLVGAFPGAGRAAFALVRSGRPLIIHGVQSGDVSARSAVVWARADRAGRLVVEIGATESMRRARRVRGPLADASTDYTAQVEVRGLPPGQDVFYRARFEVPDDHRAFGEPVVGHLRTAPTRPRDVSFVWGGDTAGQGWGINPEFGGMRIYETMRRLQPDFFVHSGDIIYADGPLRPEVPLPGGGVWRNVVTPEKSKVAETLDEFRGNHRYNLLDDNVRRLNGEVPLLAPVGRSRDGQQLVPGRDPRHPRYSIRDVDVLAARANRAFHEYTAIATPRREERRIYRKVAYGPSLDVFFLDMRTYRGPNTANDQPAPSHLTQLMGDRQLRWLERELRTSQGDVEGDRLGPPSRLGGA